MVREIEGGGLVYARFLLVMRAGGWICADFVGYARGGVDMRGFCWLCARGGGYARILLVMRAGGWICADFVGYARGWTGLCADFIS